MWCPRPRHCSNGTFPSDPTVSKFSNVEVCPINQATIFDSGGICIWQLNASSPCHHQSHCSLGPSISSVITRRIRFQSGYGSCPSCISYCCGDLHHSCFSIAAYGHLCGSQHVHPLCQLLNCMRVRSFLSFNGECKDHSCSSILRDNIGVASPIRYP